jgi:glucoamylase
MRAFMEVNDYDLSKIQSYMNSYVAWVTNVHQEQSPNNIDIRGEVKFNLPNGDVTNQAWCRPQNDGPALRALTLTLYANVLLNNG